MPAPAEGAVDAVPRGGDDSITRRRPFSTLRPHPRGSVPALFALAALVLGAFPVSVAVAAAANHPQQTPEATGHGYKPGFLACEATNTAGINDRSFNSLAWKALQQAQSSDPSMRIEYVQSTSERDYARNITKFVERKCNLIVTVGAKMATATQIAAAENPNEDFVIVDNQYTPAMNNVLALSYDTNQDAFLGGYLAAAMSKSGKVGTFGGENVPADTIYMDGWVAGVRYYDQLKHKHVVVLGWTPKRGRPLNSFAGSGLFTLSSTNQADGRTYALSEIQNGADVIFPVVSDEVAVGAAESVMEDRGVTMEWAGTDGCVSHPSYCPLFLTSVTKGVTTSVSRAVLRAASGSFAGGNYVGTLANGGVALAPYHTFANVIPSSVQKEISKLRRQIGAGAISVDPNSYRAVS